jgi:quercetin dioxygenase-like cupin family protein
MQITRCPSDSQQGPPEWFTGTAWLEEIAVPAAPSRLRVHSVHFMPGARTVWHRHSLGQVLNVTAGAGLVQRAGGPVEQIRAGTRSGSSPASGTGTAPALPP